MGVAMVLAVLLSVGLFIVLPSLAEKGILSLGASGTVATLIGGLTKVLILIAYMIFCGMVPDVRRTFQYHGAEHKTVYCHEHNLPLTPKNAQQFTTLHPRCGTALPSTLLPGRGGRELRGIEGAGALGEQNREDSALAGLAAAASDHPSAGRRNARMRHHFHERRAVWAAEGRAAYGRGLGDSDLL